MANRPLGNMVINLSLNSTSFSNTINGIKKQINVATSAMKANMAILSSAGNEYEKLEAKVNGLNEVMTANEKQIELLRRKYNEAKDAYGENSKEAQNLARSLNNAIARQGQYARQLDQATVAMKDYQRGTQNLKNELNTVEKTTNAYVRTLQAQGKSYQAVAARLAGLQRSQTLQTQIVQKEKEKLNELISAKGKDARETKIQQAAYAEARAKLSEYEASINDIKNRYQNISSESAKFADHLTEIGNKFTENGEKAKVWGSTLTKSLTAPIGAVSTLAAKISSEMSSIQGNIQAMTKATAGEAKKQGKIVGQVWADGFGESTDEVADAVIKIKQNLRGIDDSQLKSVTEKALTLSKITGADIQESLRGVNSLMVNFGMSANEAFDYMVTGAQRGLNKSGELEDNIAEYGQLWAQNGFSAKEMFSILENGLKSGAYNFDKVNDFVKEFGISLNDGRFQENIGSFSEKTQELFDKYKSGKATVKDVFNSAINDLKGMKNQQEKLTIASTVWSALGEDNAMKVIESLNNTNKAYDNVAGSADKASKALTNTPAAQFRKAWREVQIDLQPVGDTLLNLGATILPKISGAIKKIMEPFQKMPTTMQAVTLGIAGFIASIGPMFMISGMVAGTIGKAITGFRNLQVAMGATSITGGILRGVMASLTSPITLIIAGIAALAAGFIIAYNKSKPFHDFVNNLGKSISNAYGKVKQFVSAITQMFQGNWAGGATLLKKIGLSDDQIQAIIIAVTKVQNIFKILKGYIQQALSAVGSFVKKQISGLVKFWNENGSTITQATKNVFKVIGVIIKTALAILTPIFKVGFKALVVIVKSVWDNIKGIFEGSIKIIEGIILTFSGLFTGNWKKMWQGIKDIFKGAFKLILNWFELMWIGKMLKAAKVFVGPFKAIFSKLWSAIKTIFSAPIKWIVNLVKKGWNSLTKISSSFSSGFKKLFSKMWSSIKSIFSTPLKWIINLVKNGWSSLTKISSSLSSGLKNIFSKMWNSLKSIFSSPLKWLIRLVKNGWNSMKDQSVKIAESMKNKISSVWDKIVSTTKSLPNKMANGIKGGARALERAMISIGNAMLRGLGKGVNGVRKGINWILDKVHAPKSVRIPKWKVPQFAKGTDNFQGGLAVVGDGGKHELISLPNGEVFLSPNSDTLVNLPKGTSILNGNATEQLMSLYPHFANGTGWLENAWSTIKSVGRKVTGKILSAGKTVWDYMSNPKKLIDKAVSSFTNLSGLENPTLDIAKGAVTTVKDASVNWIKKFFDMGEPSGSGVQRWRPYVIRALEMNGLSTSPSMVNKVLRQIKTESGGNPRAVQHGYTDINTIRGDLAKGLMQTISSTFNAYKFPGHDNIFNGFDNLLAALNYAKHRYGKSLSALGKGHGYANGGLITRNQIVEVGEGNKPEMIIPLDPLKRTRALQLLSQTQKILGVGNQIQGGNVGNKSLNQSSNVSVSNEDESVMYKLLQATLQQNQILMQLLKKDNSVYLDGKELYDNYNKYAKSTTNIRNMFKGVTTVG